MSGPSRSKLPPLMAKAPRSSEAAVMVSEPPDSTKPLRSACRLRTVLLALLRYVTVNVPVGRSRNTSSPAAGRRLTLNSSRQLLATSQKPSASTFQKTLASTRRSSNRSKVSGNRRVAMGRRCLFRKCRELRVRFLRQSSKSHGSLPVRCRTPRDGCSRTPTSCKRKRSATDARNLRFYLFEQRLGFAAQQGHADPLVPVSPTRLCAGGVIQLLAVGLVDPLGRCAETALSLGGIAQVMVSHGQKQPVVGAETIMRGGLLKTANGLFIGAGATLGRREHAAAAGVPAGSDLSHGNELAHVGQCVGQKRTRRHHGVSGPRVCRWCRNVPAWPRRLRR